MQKMDSYIGLMDLHSVALEDLNTRHVLRVIGKEDKYSEWLDGYIYKYNMTKQCFICPIPLMFVLLADNSRNMSNT